MNDELAMISDEVLISKKKIYIYIKTFKMF